MSAYVVQVTTTAGMPWVIRSWSPGILNHCLCVNQTHDLGFTSTMFCCLSFRTTHRRCASPYCFGYIFKGVLFYQIFGDTQILDITWRDTKVTQRIGLLAPSVRIEGLRVGQQKLPVMVMMLSWGNRLVKSEIVCLREGEWFSEISQIRYSWHASRNKLQPQLQKN